jgi:short-subunit dehydrogenase
MKGGRALGIVVSPQYLAKRGLRAMFHGRSKITVPFVYSKILLLLIALAPTCLLRLIRRLGWF